MKLSGNRLKMSDGSIRHFRSPEARDHFERIAKAVKYGGFKPTKNRKKGRKKK